MKTFVLVAIVVTLFYEGLIKIPVGWKGKVLFLGRRTKMIRGEGWSWVLPFLHTITLVDCRQKVHKLTHPKALTADKTDVAVTGNYTVRVNRTLPDEYFEVPSSDAIKILDGVWMSAIKNAISVRKVEEAAVAKAEVAREVREDLAMKAESLGLEILAVTIETVTPEEEIQEEMEGAKRENLQATREIIEAHTMGKIYSFLTGKDYVPGPEDPPSPKFTPNQAFEAMLSAMGKAEKKRVTSAELQLPEWLADIMKGR